MHERDGSCDSWGFWHEANPPDMSDAGPHEAGARIVNHSDDPAYRARLAEVAAQMDAGRRGGPDWETQLDRLHRQAEAEQAEAATVAPSLATTAQDDRTPVLAPVAPPPPQYEPCQRCGADALASNRLHSKDGRLLLCGECQAYAYRFGSEPISAARALVLMARQARERLRRAGR